MADVPKNANEHCPGAESDNAGKESACAGCPNQQLCSSGAAKEVDPGIDLVKARLGTVKHKLMVLSGKGGVGKSTVTTLLARFLASNDENTQVAVCDIDICGPSMPRMLGAVGEQVHQSGSGWSPIYVDENLSLISIGFLIGAEDAVIWRGPKKNAMVRQFLSDVDWGELDYLIIDTPPGTSDEHLSAATYLSQAGLSGAIVVTTPQEVSLLDARKMVNFCQQMNIPLLGVIENMATFSCPHCQVDSVLFRPTTGGAKKMCLDLNVPFLGSLPLDPRVVKCCDEGENFVLQFPDSSTNATLKQIVEGIQKLL